MNKNLKLVVNNLNKDQNYKYFFEKDELKIILDLYAKMVSEGSWKIYKICKNFKPISQNLKYIITDSRSKVLKNSNNLENLLKNTNWKKLQK